MNKYNVFLCYRGEKSALLANSIYSDLKNLDNPELRVFYAPRCIPFGKDFVETCEKIAGQVSLMILLITEDFFNNVKAPTDVVGKEIYSALNNKNCRFLPVLFPEFDFGYTDLSSLFSKEDIPRFAHVNPLRYTSIYTFNFQSLYTSVFEELDIDKNTVSAAKIVKKRTHISEEQKGNFFSDENTTEKRRLNQQQELLLGYDMPIYEKLLAGRENLRVLDLGSGNGTTVMNRLGNRPEVEKIIGIEFDGVNVEHANKNFAGSNAVFYQGDVEAADFGSFLREVMDENGIEAFDFINILALISHLKNPSKLLKTVKKFCADNAVIFIRNIDDGFNIAFPDENRNFEKALSLFSSCTSSGYRYSGRQLFTYLKKCGYTDITLEKTGIDTTRMGASERDVFFDVIFQFLEQGLKKEVSVHPESDELQALLDWYEDVKDSLEDSFMSQEFFFHFGFLIYTARVKK